MYVDLMRTVGCQWSSRRPFGSTVTMAAAIVVEIGKFLESTIWIVPPPPGALVAGSFEP